MRLKKIATTFTLILILSYGISRLALIRLFSDLVNSILSIFNLDADIILRVLNSLYHTKYKDVYREDLLGWLIYYPTYLMFHILFIFLLFSKERKVRNYLSIGLVSIVFLLVVCIIIFKLAGMIKLYVAFYSLFKSLFGLPFILLAIEGGRILYTDIIELSNSKQ